MRFSHFLEDLNRLSPRLFPYDEVNIEGLRLAIGGLEMTIEETENEGKLAEAKETIADFAVHISSGNAGWQRLAFFCFLVA